MDNERFEKLIRAWRQSFKKMPPHQHREATAFCPSLAALEGWLKQKQASGTPARLSEHIQSCLYCTRRVAYLRRALSGQKAAEEQSACNVLAADATISEKTNYQLVPVTLAGEGYTTTHQCLARLDRENGATVYITLIIPPELKSFREISMEGRRPTPAFAKAARQVYVADDHLTAVARITGVPIKELQSLEDIQITLHF